MAENCQTVIDLARLTLNDDAKARWPDADCLRYLQDGLDALYTLRPDLFLGIYATFDSSALELDTPSDFPIPDRYRRLVADYIIFRCETVDDEAVNSGRAANAQKYFVSNGVQGY